MHFYKQPAVLANNRPYINTHAIPNGRPVACLQDFESLYIASRKKEGRLYSDDDLKKLPSIDPQHLHYREWMLRKRSANRLLAYLRKKDRPLSVLEIGCGNGWLSRLLSALPGSVITGSDINITEIEQARRVFDSQHNTHFVTASIGDPYFREKKFDIIVFAASIQYFPNARKIIEAALQLLGNAGELHIMDTHFYRQPDIAAAKKRSQRHYQLAGCAALADFYHHHAIQSLQPFAHDFLFNPYNLVNRLFNKKDVFPWIRIIA